MTHATPLHDGWTLHLESDPDGLVPAAVRDALPIAATVPGVVHTDLLAAGLIPDPYVDATERELDWIGRVAWRYELGFDAARVPGEEAELAFDGLDTVATVELNGVELGRTENQHRRYRFRATPHLRSGGNTLVVRFASAWGFGEAEAVRVGGRMPSQYPGPFNHLRKSACNFGWDWGPALVTAGIWRPVRLERWSVDRLASVRPVLGWSDGVGTIAVAVELAAPAPERLAVSVEVAGSRRTATIAPGSTTAAVAFDVPGARRWDVRGYGEAALADLTVGLATSEGRELDSWNRRVGFRTAALDTRPDSGGSRFELHVNGALLPVRGANWIPDDCFPSRVTRERLRDRLTQAIGAGINLLRIWGGGTYESEDLYELCDELGIAVWQDFLFACATYPEDEHTAAEVEAEARDNVERLMPHPSLVLWNGNNENIWGFEDWDWKEGVAGRAWGLGYYLELLPRVVAEVDPSRPYWPGSPYSGSTEIHPNDPDHGTMHLWDAWNREDYASYRTVQPRFVAEFGWQAPPTFSTIRRSVTDEPLRPDSPGMLHHQKAEDGQGKLTRGIGRHLPEPAGFDDWLLATQVTQARALRTGLEYFRSQRPRCTGAILWQLNDCWPVTSWALVDGEGRLKPAWYAVRAAFAERLLTIQPTPAGLELVAVTDAAEPWTEEVAVTRMTFDGTVLASATLRVEAGPLGTARLPLDPALAGPVDLRAEVLVAEGPSGRALWLFAEDRDLDLRDGLTADARRLPDGDVELVLRSPVLAREVCVLADRVHPAAESDESVVTLLPGEERRLRVRGVPPGRENELTRAPVLRSIDQVVLAAREGIAGR